MTGEHFRHAQELEAALKAAQTEIAELHQALRARERFMAVAAHELRNPIAPMLLQAQLLLRIAVQEGSPRLVEGLEQIEQLAARCAKRANILLEVSRLAADRFELEPVACDLAVLIDQTIEEFAPLADRAGCPLRVSILPDAVGWWDPVAIQQIVENILSNALKFGAGHPVEIKMVKDGPAISLMIVDQGPGITQEDLKKVFAPFTVVMARASGGGFGVGLWVVSQLVNKMQGRISVDSAPGRGTRVTITLPIFSQANDVD
jgi:signal transduction histidine kinase